MVVSAGKDLFLVVLTWKWDNRVDSVLYVTWHSQRGLYTEEWKEALWKEKQKGIPPRGPIPDAESNRRDLPFSSEND